MQLGQQPIQRLRQNGEPAVILHGLQVRRQGVHHVFLLRSGKQGGVADAGPARLDLSQIEDLPGSIQAVLLAHVIFARQAALGQPCRGEITLHHGDIAALRFLLEGGAIFVDIGKLGFLVFALVTVEGWAGIGRVELV